MGRLGTVTLQALDRADVFLRENIFPEGITDSSELQTGIPQPGFEHDKAYLSGAVTKIIPVCVEGDTSVIYGWFAGENFSAPFSLIIYIEYEEETDLGLTEKEEDDD